MAHANPDTSTSYTQTDKKTVVTKRFSELLRHIYLILRHDDNHRGLDPGTYTFRARSSFSVSASRGAYYAIVQVKIGLVRAVLYQTGGARSPIDDSSHSDTETVRFIDTRDSIAGVAKAGGVKVTFYACDTLSCNMAVTPKAMTSYSFHKFDTVVNYTLGHGGLSSIH